VAKIVVIGSLNMDVVAVAPRIPVTSETIIGNKYFTAPGGKGNNQAFAAARLGGDTAMLGRIGDDDFGRQMKQNLADVGCDVSGIGITPGSSGVALIFVAETGQNSIIVVPGANDAFRPQHIDAAQLRGAALVLLQLENPMETVLAAAKKARDAGGRVILDPAPAPARPLPAELLRMVDILTPNETEAAILAGMAPGRLNPTQAVDVARKLQAAGANAVVVKLGDQGCVVVDTEGATLLPAPQVNAADTTAAGDNFNGALAVGLSEGMSLREATTMANNAAAWSVTHIGHGPSATPTRAQVDEFTKQGQGALVATTLA
jgi:ribokinase